MADELKRSKGTDPPLCKICGHRHRFADPHVFGSKPPAPSIRTKPSEAPRSRHEHPRAIDVTDARGRTKQVEFSGSSSGRTAAFDAANLGSNPGPEAKPGRAKGGAKKRASPSPVKDTIAALGELVDAASKRIASKPKRKKSMVAKDGTNRGRPKKPGGFDKKAHDREKARERRAAKKAAAQAAKP